ncbi:substrate-binding domain-containing protein [Geothrix sp. PMB-07]|uniref:substrate-binding domain-containing protein n=1 Tax=Geothrix sp. PMB-07 TaxID=3068640 RepID=UPI0027419066|nr:substrate-binding domain-containing protein [Geothrix sp. PMB-07]WLT32387.1 substrate-binding domain-containing protein [Geothrix sp. PMB-07]
MFMAMVLRSLLLASAAVSLAAQPPQRMLLLASTIGPIESGIVDRLEERFEQDTGIRVRHVGAGTGAALDLARQGSIDLLLVHAKSLEDAFVKEGFGTERVPLMYNDFVIVGPGNDPAGIRGRKTAAEALRAILEKGSAFVSRGDKSGTHMAELGLWAKAGLDPSGPGYQVFAKGSEGNTATLLHTDQLGAYTVIDRASFFGLRGRLKLQILLEGDEALLNHISLIPVNPARFPNIHHREAEAFVTWLTDPAKGQKVIAIFGDDTYGSALFKPEARTLRGMRTAQESPRRVR